MLVRDKLTWEDMCSDPRLRDLPFKIELNRLNQIVMSPVHPRHSRLQSKIARILGDLLSEGEAIVELAIETEDRTKVPDVVWASKATIAHHLGEISWLSVTGDLCGSVVAGEHDRRDGQKASPLFRAWCDRGMVVFVGWQYDFLRQHRGAEELEALPNVPGNHRSLGVI